MNQRDHQLKKIRPDYMTTTINDVMSNEERFQNLVLRPIIKFQNDLIINVFKNYVGKHKNVFNDYAARLVEPTIRYHECYSSTPTTYRVTCTC